MRKLNWCGTEWREKIAYPIRLLNDVIHTHTSELLTSAVAKSQHWCFACGNLRYFHCIYQKKKKILNVVGEKRTISFQYFNGKQWNCSQHSKVIWNLRKRRYTYVVYNWYSVPKKAQMWICFQIMLNDGPNWSSVDKLNTTLTNQQRWEGITLGGIYCFRSILRCRKPWPTMCH